jgi:membrane-associated protein
MELLTQALDFVLHLDVHLNTMVDQLGPWLYVVLFAIIFCETGLVVTPILPGDSLLFAVGAVAANSSLSLLFVLLLLILAAILGDAVNYAIGYRIGPKVFKY